MEKVLTEVEKKKRSLKRYRRNLSCIDRLENKLAAVNDRLTSISSPKYSGMPRGGDPVTTEDLVADKLELEERINRLKQRSNRYRAEILEEIDTIDDPKAVEVMELFCIEQYSLEEIADRLLYSYRQVCRIYTRTIRQLADEGSGCH